MAAMLQSTDDPHEAVTHWLQEVARRQTPGRRDIPAKEPRLSVQQQKPASSRAHSRTRYKGLLLLAGLSATYLEYYFFDVLLQTVSVHSLIVFILADMH